MRTPRRAGWRHWMAALAGLAAFIAMLWTLTLGSEASGPTAPAPAGSRPMAASPDSP
ncbi:MAG: hypothetical protein IT208_12725 [Chthonomonadales bacterium]|nr:hypothetical protein [Chthonomonadales bacterium]